MLTPLLTEFDPAESAEGGIDPLGLNAIADSLAVRLVPGIRERMRRPRFLTAIAVSAVVCSEFDHEVSTLEQEIDPSLIFEMYLVEGLSRNMSVGEEIVNVPGSLKARNAIRSGFHLTLSRYLRVPSVFGFHGIYKRLAQDLDIVSSGHIGETGYRLLKTWMKEQRLEGFYGTDPGPGSILRQQLTEAVRVGFETQGVNRTSGWSTWSFFKQHLSPAGLGKEEARLILQAILQSDSRRQVIDFLRSEKGHRLWEATWSERQFHEALMDHVGPEIQELLRAILLYEQFSRILMDALNDSLYLMTTKIGKVSPDEVGKTKGAQIAAERVPKMHMELSERLAPFEESIRFENSFHTLAQHAGSAEWIQLLFDHHKKIQKFKPPNGKNPWFETFDDGSVVIRPLYKVDELTRYDGEYVGLYRTRPLYDFLVDLLRS